MEEEKARIEHLQNLGEVSVSHFSPTESKNLMDGTYIAQFLPEGEKVFAVSVTVTEQNE